MNENKKIHPGDVRKETNISEDQLLSKKEAFAISLIFIPAGVTLLREGYFNEIGRQHYETNLKLVQEQLAPFNETISSLTGEGYVLSNQERFAARTNRFDVSDSLYRERTELVAQIKTIEKSEEYRSLLVEEVAAKKDLAEFKSFIPSNNFPTAFGSGSLMMGAALLYAACGNKIESWFSKW